MENLKKLDLTDEEKEIIKSILLKRSTFYAKKITDRKFLLLKLRPEEVVFRKKI